LSNRSRRAARLQSHPRVADGVLERAIETEFSVCLEDRLPGFDRARHRDGVRRCCGDFPAHALRQQFFGRDRGARAARPIVAPHRLVRLGDKTKQSPPMPVIAGSTTHSVATAATAASAALPPAFSVSMAAMLASGWEVAAIPSRA